MLTTTAPLADGAIRRRALTEHDRTLLVEAGAGSGKTALLAGRVTLMCAAGIAPREIAAITFTEVAASELRERIERYLSRLARNEIPNELAVALPMGLNAAQHAALKSALESFDELICTTIHGFCQRLLQPYPVEAGLDPGARIVDAAACELMREETVTAWLAEHFGRGREEDPASEDDILVALVETGNLDAVRAIRRWANHLVKSPHAVPSCAEQQGGHEGAAFCSAVRGFAEWYRSNGFNEPKAAEYLAEFERITDAIEALEDDIPTDRQLIGSLRHQRPSACKANSFEFRAYQTKGLWKSLAKQAGLPTERGERMYARAEELYLTCGDTYARWCEKLAERACARVVRALSPLHQAFHLQKTQSALLDFDDLLTHARDLVRDNPHVRRALRERHPYLLVDEFQDTDPLQAELFWRLCGQDEADHWHRIEPRAGSLFLVADPKQAIYRFRGADIETYLRAKTSICALGNDVLLEITTNFRSDEGILEFVNMNFRPLLEAQNQPGFAALRAPESTIDRGTREESRAALYAIDVDLHISADENTPNSTLSRDELRIAEARAVAQAVAVSVHELSIVDRHTRRERPCVPGDLALLSATGSSLWLYERELDRLGIPIASQAGKGFFRRQEVHDLIAVVRAIADSNDTLAFGALLRGPLVGLSEEAIADALLEVEAAGTRLTIRTEPSLVGSPVLRETLGILRRLARKARRSTPYQVVAEAIELLNMRALLLLRLPRSAERALANLDQFLAMAREYDVRGLFAFAQALRERWASAKKREEGRIDQAKDAVLVSTIHSSKGLEWPIVIPINSMTKLHGAGDLIQLDRRDGSAHFKVLGMGGAQFHALEQAARDEHRAEAVRLWYVALTRARDMLLLPRLSNRPKEDWMSAVNLDLTALPCLEVLPLRYQPPEAQRAVAQDGASWDAESERIRKQIKSVTFHYPSRADTFIEASDEKGVVLDPAGGDLVQQITGGRERGTLLHKLLEEIITHELEREPSAISSRAEELLAQLTPAPGAFSIDIAEATASIMRTLELELIKELLPRLRAEVPLFAAREEEERVTVTAGVADAIALDSAGGCEIVIDWKSDVDPERAPLGEYRAQIEAYLGMTGARVGYLVFLTTGRVITVYPQRSP